MTTAATAFEAEGASGPLEDGHERPPYAAAGVAGLAVFALYAITLARSTAFWDTSEYIATAHVLGIPHPPGNPLFVVLARAWSVLLSPLGLSVAVRINLFSAFASALAHALWFLVVHHVLRYFTDERGFRLAGATAAVLVSATTFTIWNQSNVNEKVYTVSLLTIALLSWLAFRWQENLGKGKDDNLLVLIVFILALSVGNHLMAFLAAPAIGAFILVVRRSTFLNWRLYPAALVAALLGLSIHLFLPLRAGLDPVINEAAPTCPDLGSSLAAIVSYGKAGCEALAQALTRTQYDKPSITVRQATLGAQLVNYLQYFDWQWARSVNGTNVVFAILRLPFTMLFTAFGMWGAIEHARRDKASFVYVSVLFATLSVALVYYLNFKYGYSLTAPEDNRDLHEVRERDYFFIVSFSVWGLWAGIGIATFWKEATDVARTTISRTSPILAFAAIPLVANWSYADRSYDHAARDWAYNLLMSVEPYGILFTNGDNDTFPLWYLQEVEAIRQDVTVVVTSYLNTDWYAKQLRRLTEPCPPGVSPADDPTRVICQRPYEPGDAGAAYVHNALEAGDRVPILMAEPIRAPTKSIMPLDDETIEGIAARYSVVETDQILRIGNLNAPIKAGTYLTPWQQYAYVMINHVIDERPIHFATSGNAALELSLTAGVVRQGLAFKLHNGAVADDPPDGALRMMASPYQRVIGDWVDIPRTRQLFDEVFIHRSGLPDGWEFWPDRSTIGIPNYYAWGNLALARGASQVGDEEAAARYQGRAASWFELGS